MNIDIHPQIEGSVTLNALNQTLPQLLTRIGKQVDMRYEIDGKNLTVLPDAPVWRNYKVDYVNMARSTNSSVNIATQISTAGGGSNSASNPVGGRRQQQQYRPPGRQSFVKNFCKPERISATCCARPRSTTCRSIRWRS